MSSYNLIGVQGEGESTFEAKNEMKEHALSKWCEVIVNLRLVGTSSSVIFGFLPSDEYYAVYGTGLKLKERL